MKNKTLLIVLTVVVAVVVIFVVYFSINSVSKTINDANINQMLIGGQKDAHDCLIAAGYSWCEPKQKCLRSWEEDCYGADLKSLIAFFGLELSYSDDQIHVTISKNIGNYFAGGIKIGSIEGEGGAFLARKINNTWQIDYEGNGSIDCVKIKALGYPVEVLEGFCD